MKAAVVLFIATAAAGAASARAESKNVLSLPALLEKARAHTRLLADDYAIAAARAQKQEATGARLPKLTATAFLGPSPEINCANPECTVTTPREATVAFDGAFGGVRLNLAQPLFTFGKLSAVSDAARHAVATAEQQRRVTEAELVVQATRAYYGLKLARELLYMLEDGQEQLQKAEAQVKKDVNAGTGETTVQDRLRLETLSAEVDARISEAREAEAIALAGVRAIANDATADIDKEPLEAQGYELEARPSYQDKAKTIGPELATAREKSSSVGALATAESRKFWPDLLLMAGFNFSRAQGVDNPPSAFANDPFNTSGATIGLALQWTLDPLTQWARRARAEAQARQAEALLRAAASLSDVQVAAAHAKATAARDRIKATQKGEKSARGWVASVLSSDAIGITSPKDLGDAYVAYFTMRARLLQSLYDWNLAIAELSRLSGESTSPRARPTPRKSK